MRWILAASLALTGCVTTSNVTRARAHALVARGAMLIDVRDPGEFAERHPPEAVNIPLPKLVDRVAGVDRKTPVIVYCHTGVRAAIASERLRKAGFTEVYNLGTLGHWYYERIGPSPSFE